MHVPWVQDTYIFFESRITPFPLSNGNTSQNKWVTRTQITEAGKQKTSSSWQDLENDIHSQSAYKTKFGTQETHKSSGQDRNNIRDNSFRLSYSKDKADSGSLLRSIISCILGAGSTFQQQAELVNASAEPSLRGHKRLGSSHLPRSYPAYLPHTNLPRKT